MGATKATSVSLYMVSVLHIQSFAVLRLLHYTLPCTSGKTLHHLKRSLICQTMSPNPAFSGMQAQESSFMSQFLLSREKRKKDKIKEMLVKEMQKEPSYFYSVPCQESHCVCVFLLFPKFGMTIGHDMPKKVLLKAMLLCFYLVLTLLQKKRTIELDLGVCCAWEQMNELSSSNQQCLRVVFVSSVRGFHSLLRKSNILEQNLTNDWTIPLLNNLGSYRVGLSFKKIMLYNVNVPSGPSSVH